MKRIALFLLVLGTGLLVNPQIAKAQFNDEEPTAVECDTWPGASHVFVKIDSSFGGSWQDASVWTDSQNLSFQVIRRHFGFTEVSYTGAGFDLRIDTFIHNGVRVGESYDADLTVDDVNDGATLRVRCEFLPF